MNSDIRISTALLKSKKVRKLLRQKGKGALFGLLSIWIDAAIYRPDGKFHDYEMEDLMDIAETQDETFVGALVELGLLDFDGKTYSIHNWLKHNLWASGSEKRIETARKAAEVRWNKRGSNSNEKPKQ